jgi:hypothetical protein
MHLSWTMAATLAMAVSSGVAMAQERPPITPTRDVTVEYSYSAVAKDGGGQQGQSRISSTAGGKRMRLEGFTPAGYMIVDRANGLTIMVMDSQRIYMEMPFDPARAGPFALRENMKFARKGGDTVAGVRCTVWEIEGDQGSGTACITDDGVLLRGESAGRYGRVLMTATSVTYAPLSDSMFQAPAGYHKMQMPTLPPGAGRPAKPQP